MRKSRSIGMILAVVLATSPAVLAQKTKAKSQPKSRVYMGREIADVMSFAGADWLIRETREQEEQPNQMLAALNLKPGQTVADVGAGVGYTSIRIARIVGPTGTVLATDVQPEMLAMLKDNATLFGVKNIKPIRCTATDTKLPENAVDLILMVDVYHECSDPEATLKGLRKALKPDGRLVLIEFRAEDPEVPIKPEHKMTVVQAKKELEANGFKFKESIEILPWQHIIIFNKSEEKKDEAKKPETKKEEDK